MRRASFRSRAAAALLLLPLSAACQYEDVVRQVSQPNYTHYLNELLFTRAGDNRGPASVQHEAARTNIRDTLAAFGLKTSLDPFYYQGGTFYNVTAVLPGKTRPDEYHVLGAHYDSVNNPGADDDASGVAAVLEAARVASMHEFEASLVFVAFDREEAGLVGSKAWAAAHSGDRILSMLQLDMIGYNPPAGFRNLVAVCVANELENPAAAVIVAAIAQYGGGLMPASGCISTRSDHASFAWLAPSVMLIEAGFSQNLHYHRPADSVDTPSYIDYAFASGVARSTVGYLAQQAGMLPEDTSAPRLSPGGVVSSASFIARSVAPAELVTLFGSGFGDRVAIAISDSAGNEQAAAASYVSPRQINMLMPANLPPGAATITLTRDDGLRTAAVLNVEAIAPGVFTAEMSGLGAPSAQAVRVASDGAQTVQNLFECAGADGCHPVPVDFGGENDRVWLVLYGTGIRGRSAAGAVTLEVDGERFPAEYAGAQPDFAGLDQVNVELPRALRGKGWVIAALRVDGKSANPVAIDLGSE